MKRRLSSFVLGPLSLVLGAAAVAFVPWPAAGADGQGQRAKDQGQVTKDDVQDFVFLADTRPVLVRLHVQTDGKSFRAAWDDYVQYLFKYLDANGDGSLSKEEAERAPPIDAILAGGGGFALAPPNPNQPGQPSMAALDADKDGKVTPAELAAYYRKNGFAPFQIQTGPSQPLPPRVVIRNGGGQPDVQAGAVAEAVFALLDTDKDGKLTKEKLAAAEQALLKADADDDEVVTVQELVPNAGGQRRIIDDADAVVVRQRPAGPAAAAPVVLLHPGEPAAELVRRLQERYGPKADKPEGKKLTQKDLGLDKATFEKLDADKDGVLDKDELAGFAKRPPDLELVVRLGKKGADEAKVEVAGDGKSPLAGRVKAKDGVVQLDLGVVKLDLRDGADEDRVDQFGNIVRQRYVAQFKQADADNNGYLDETEARNNPLFRGQFKMMDRDGDGKLYEKEVLEYLDKMADLQARAMTSCVSMSFADQGRGLFDLLDTNRDGRLSVREMRQAPKLLDQLDKDGKGHVAKGDVPRIYQLAVRRGPAGGGGLPGVFAVRLADTPPRPVPEPKNGPLWFRKMDRNTDGDVSRREFLGTDEEFRKIDADGDGLISLEEAEKADALFRKQK